MESNTRCYRSEFHASTKYALCEGEKCEKHFIPVFLWEEIKEQIGGSEEDTYICMIAEKM